MKALLVEGVFHWGFSVRIITESAGAQYYPLPPPSTLIGALAYGVNALLAHPECEAQKRKNLYSGARRLRRAVKWAAFALSDELSVGGKAAAIGYSDFIRSFRLIYQRGVRHQLEQKRMWYGISAHGKVYACGAGFKVLYLIDERGLEELGVSEDVLVRSALSIVRIGAREGLVSIFRARLTDSVKPVNAPTVTEYYFPSRLAEIGNPEEVMSIMLPVMSDRLWEFRPRKPLGLSDHEEYYTPGMGYILRPGRIEVVRLNKGALALKACLREREEVVVVPDEVMR